MPKQEKLLPLPWSSTDKHRFNLTIPSASTDYYIDVNSLDKIARFMGFAEVSIFSNSLLPELEREIAVVQSRIQDLEVTHLPLKAQWRRIAIYLDIEKIVRNNQHLLSESEFKNRIEEIIKQELQNQGEKNLNRFDRVGFSVDLAMFLASITLIASVFNRYEIHDHNSYLFWASIVCKMLLSFIDSKVHYVSTKYGSRVSLIESSEYDKLAALPIKLDRAKLLYLKPKP